MLGDAETTAQRLRLLKAEFTQPTRSGPGDGRSSRITESPALVNVNVVDRVAAARAEVEAHTRAAVPGTDPYRGPDDGVYEWSVQQTAALDPTRQRITEALHYKQGLEHALAMGDTTVIRKLFCPACGCLGLYWRAAARKAVCVQHYCTDKDGLANTWSLARLARNYVEGKESSVRRAT